MSETTGQPEAQIQQLLEELAEARERVETAEINFEHAENALDEAEDDLSSLLGEIALIN